MTKPIAAAGGLVRRFRRRAADDRAAVAALDVRYQAAVKANDAGDHGGASSTRR